MNKSFFRKMLSKHKTWLLLGIFTFAGLFGFGFHQILSVNTPRVPEIKEPPLLKVPREYSPSDSLLDLKIERDRDRSQEKERVQELLDKVGLTDETRKQAEQELWRLTQATAKEQELETLLKAKGFQESMVSISPKIVTVIVTGKMDAERAGTIGRMTADVTGYGVDQIEIVEK
jgi:stage III sporulation protein AH